MPGDRVTEKMAHLSGVPQAAHFGGESAEVFVPKPAFKRATEGERKLSGVSVHYKD